MTISYKSIVIFVAHVLLWLAILVPTFYATATSLMSIRGMDQFPFFIPILNLTIIYLSVFYFNYYLFVPKYYASKQHAKYVLSLLSLVGFFLLITGLVLRFTVGYTIQRLQSEEVTAFIP